LKASTSNIFILFLVFSASAQETLTLDNAIKLGLEKNYAVLISKNDVEIAKAQNNIGNAGMSPSVSLNANMSFANINSYQEFSNGTSQDKKGAQNNNTGAALNVSWMVFDGMRMFAVKKRLGLNEKLNEFELKQQMENTVYNIMTSYYDIVRISKLILAGKQNLSIYEERIKVTKLRMDIGSDSKVDFLLTVTDENRVKSDILRLEQQLAAAKINLNALLVRPVETEFEAQDTIVINYAPSIEELKKSTLKNNSAILIAQQNQMIGEQLLKESKSTLLPQIQLNGSYNFILSKSQAGFLTLNKQSGLNAGLSASWLLFNGNRNRKLVLERQISLLNTKLFIDESIKQVDALVYINYKNFLTNKLILDLEKSNLQSASELITISLERYRLGKTNLLETKETQKTYEDAQVRYINSLYDAKLSEAQLLRSNGTLIK
jgi:outer membrane protein